MSLRRLPELRADRLPDVCAFEPDADALARWHAGVHARSDDDATISILDVIGQDFWTGEGVTSKRIAAALRAIGDRDVTVNVNSPGGDFFEGVAIYNMLRDHPRKVTVRVLGMAASAASVIAMAGDEIQIGKAGFLMIHNAWVVAVGNRHDLVAAADTLAPFDEAMAAVFADRAGVDQKKVAAWMDAETWFNGAQAVAEGLADGYLPADEIETDDAQAAALRPVNAIRRIDALMARAGVSRRERRSLIGEMKGATLDAGPTVTHDADAELVDALAALRQTIRG